MNIEVLKNLTILYAEDDPSIRESMQKTFRLFFKNVLDVKDGVEALEMYRNNSVDIVFMDYVMPVLDGCQAAKEIRSQDKTIPIVIMSAYADKEKLFNLLEVDGVRFLEKPVMYDRLKAVLNEIVTEMTESGRFIVKLDSDTYYSYISKNIQNGTNEKIPLTKNEISFLELLLGNKNRLLTKEMVKESIFADEDIDENTVRNLVYRLRKKINTESIVTIKDLRYLMRV